MGPAADPMLKQLKDALTSGPLLCTIAVHRRIGGVEQLPDFDSVHWHAQAVASLAAARMFESQAEDLKSASSQLMQMFLPGYQRNQLQHSRRAMSTLLRCLRFCLTSEGQQAVLAAVICLVALQVFADDAAALQAVTKEAAYSLGKNRSSVSQLAAWAITSLACRSKADCNTIAVAGGSSVLVNQLQYQPLEALEGLTKLVDQTKAFDLHNEAGLTALSRLIRGLHKLVQHPHNQAAVLQELKSSEALELCFICAKSGVDTVSKPAIDCLVLIWQWYLRKSPSASFSLTQMSCFLPKGILSTSASDGGVLAEVHRQAALEASTAVAGPVTAGVSTSTAMAPSAAVARDLSQLWSVEPVIDFAFERTVQNSPHAQPGTAPALLSQQQRPDSTPASDPRPDPGLPQNPSRSAPLPQRAPPPPTRDQSRSAGPRQTDSLEFIHSWLDTDPEGQWSPFPFPHQPSPVKSQPKGLERQTPAQQVPLTPEGKRPAQRALQFSPMSVTQPGAEVMHDHLGKVPSLEDAYLRKRKLSKGPNPAHEDSAWGSFDPQVAWSASGSSLVTTPRRESATSCDTHTHTENQSVATIDNISKPSVDSPSRLSVETTTRSPDPKPSHTLIREPDAAANRPALARMSKTSLDLPGSYAVTPSSRLSLDGQSSLPVGKGKRWTKFLTWLTDPDTRDAARAKKSGKPVKRGALYDLATPIGRCPV
ncbi:hypothetical protein WJX82_001955 [Trebouxia sp. C0006]